MGRARALEVILSAEDYDAELAERYGWINEHCPPARLAISSDRSHIGSPGFRLPAISRSRTGSMRSRLHRPTTSVAIPIYSARACTTPRPKRIQAAMKRGFQTRDAEMDLARMLGDLADGPDARRPGRPLIEHLTY